MAWDSTGKWVDTPSDSRPGGWQINPANYRNPFSVLPPGITYRDLMQGGGPPLRRGLPNHAIHAPFLKVNR